MLHRLRALALLVVLGLLLPAIAGATDVLPPLIVDPATGKYDLDDTANLANNCANVTGTVAIGNGGTGQTSATAAFDALDPLTTKGDIIVHDGTNSIRVAVGANGTVLTAASGQAAGVQWATPTTAIIPPLDFLGETVLPAGSGTWYIGLGGRVSATEADVVVPLGSGTYGNLRGYASGATGGSGSTCTLGVGTSVPLTYTGSKPAVTLTGTTPAADTTNTASTTAGQLAAIKCVHASVANARFYNLQIEKTAN